MAPTRRRTLGRPAALAAIAVLVVIDIAYLIGVLLLEVVPGWGSIVNIVLRTGPIWAPVVVFWIAVVFARGRRLPLVLAALAVTSWAVGDAFYNALMGSAGVLPSPAPSDISYLAFYGFMFAAFIALFARGSRRNLVPAFLEALIASLGAASVILVIVQPVLDSASSQPISFGTALTFMYPLLDMAIVALTAGYASNPQLAGSRRGWWFVAGIVVFIATDVVYAFLMDADQYVAGSLVDLGWPAGLGLLAWWALGFTVEPRVVGRASRSTRALGLVTPAIAVAAALAVLVFATLHPVHIAAVIAAALTVALAAIPVVTRQALLARLVAGQEQVVAEMRALDAAKSEMLATLNHEMRTPLTSVIGYLEIVRDGDGGAIPKDADDMLAAVEHNARRLNSIVDEMLVLARLDSHGLDLELASVDVRDAVSHVVAQLRPVAEQRLIDFELDVSTGAPLVLADATRLGHALTTITENALKYTPNGGRVSVSVSTREHERPVVITVTDTGVGVPAEELPRLFERFYRASNAQESGVAGTGLGLSIAQGIVDAHGGRIRALSTLGEGTSMVVTLPAAPALRG